MIKKIALWILLFVFIIASIIFAIFLYRNNNLPSSSTQSPNINLTTINYAFQIGYDICYLLIMVVLLLVAYYQLNKTKEATTISSLTVVAEKLNRADMRQNRKQLAELILANAQDKLNPLNNNRITEWFKNIPKKKERNLSEQEIIEIAIVKNRFEAVAYEFEILGYYYKNKIYSLQDIYELFSYELQRYWLLFEQIGLMQYLRDKEKGGESDFYNKFQKLFEDSMEHEIKIDDNYCNIQDKIKKLTEKKIAQIGIFLIEESKII